MIYPALTQLTGALVDPFGRIGPAAWRARMGHGAEGLPRGGVWLHGASVGEIASAAPLTARLAAVLPVAVTANTATGCDAARAQGLAARLAPLDLPQALSRFLDAVAPRVAVGIEGELWPSRSAALAARGIPQVMIGARMSARSAARWQRLGGIVGPVLGRMAAVSAQDEASEARLLALGLPRSALLARVNLKLLAALLRPVLPHPATRPLTWLAASTHEGEEQPVLAAAAALRARGLPLRLILAPRHPQRFDAVAAMMAAAGLAPARRSAGADAGAPVLLADSMGEMDLWYAAAGMVLTGGSLVAGGGGHNPWEPAAQGCALLHGADVANFAGDYARLDALGAAVATDAAGLADAVAAMLADPGATAARGARARGALEAEAGDPAPLLARILAFAGADAGLPGGGADVTMGPRSARDA